MHVTIAGKNPSNKPVAVKVVATGELKTDPAVLTALALIATKLDALAIAIAG